MQGQPLTQEFTPHTNICQVMTSLAKNIIGGVLAVIAILGVAALFVDVTRNKGGGCDGKLIQEEGRPSWGKNMEERDAPRRESDNIMTVPRKKLEKNTEDSVSVNKHSTPQI